MTIECPIDNHSCVRPECHGDPECLRVEAEALGFFTSASESKSSPRAWGLSMLAALRIGIASQELGIDGERFHGHFGESLKNLEAELEGLKQPPDN